MPIGEDCDGPSYTSSSSTTESDTSSLKLPAAGCSASPMSWSIVRGLSTISMPPTGLLNASVAPETTPGCNLDSQSRVSGLSGVGLGETLDVDFSLGREGPADELADDPGSLP